MSYTTHVVVKEPYPVEGAVSERALPADIGIGDIVSAEPNLMGFLVRGKAVDGMAISLAPTDCLVEKDSRSFEEDDEVRVLPNPGYYTNFFESEKLEFVPIVSRIEGAVGRIGGRPDSEGDCEVYFTNPEAYMGEEVHSIAPEFLELVKSAKELDEEFDRANEKVEEPKQTTANVAEQVTDEFCKLTGNAHPRIGNSVIFTHKIGDTAHLVRVTFEEVAL